MRSTKQVHQTIIDQCKDNNAKAQMQLYNLYCKAMFIISYRYVNDKCVAEDVMQEAFIKAFKNINSYKNEVPFGAWLKRIVINQSIDYLKKKKLELVSINEEVTTKVDEDDWKVECNISIDAIVEKINNLKDKYRLVLTLYLLEGYDHQEISQVLNITENTSRTHLLRGKKLLKEQLKNTSYAAGY
ncbi:RNA polymerase subunit sigma-70 [Polaribacter reichenbachii]|uniref:RNA polymerase subunit sigma-70 n=1 Tax=Polaribacter reichenbachii TaxID=996801 RepID=A0A1B8U2A9_9FLAO|nr:sigma-70 family RNA polymerase sigma factor [Polaribacter reichenbachii]APZ47733.1 RNA polymerase subunit sigma-70 [Polaribacter reichenbachii]AUC18367.1 RNA polymerase subunit sigma-70 [Polaribacter reichenbachii]OBY66024.1 RNA polymerase subunit sigma-70 [Polaribacter reichenbachii]